MASWSQLHFHHGAIMGKQRHVNYKLKPATLNAAKTADKAYTLTDGGGLYVEVLPGGSKVWRYTFRVDGRRPKVTIGPYPQISIVDARDAHEKMRAQLASGIDPSRHKKEAAAEAQAEADRGVTFEAFAKVWVAETLFYRSDTYRAQCIRFFDVYICPRIGRMPLPDVRPRDVLAIIEANRHIPTTADRCRSLIQQVYNFAIRKLLVDTNPATAVRGAVVVPPKTHHRHLVGNEIGKFWSQLDQQRNAMVITVYAAKLLMLTMVRKTELRLARWAEMDMDGGKWDIPAGRMKMGQPHRVYLSRQAVELLRYLHKITGSGEYVFPTRFVGGCGRAIGDATLNHFFKRLDFGVPEFSPHGTRGTAATLLREHGFGRDVVELLLSHQERSAVVAAYTHAELADERTRALQFLADKVEALAAQA
jgi:integrase